MSDALNAEYMIIIILYSAALSRSERGLFTSSELIL